MYSIVDDQENPLKALKTGTVLWIVSSPEKIRMESEVIFLRILHDR